MSNGDLYTILTNKAAKGKKGAIIAMIEGTGAKKIVKILKKIPETKREQVKEVTLDMAGSMNLIVKQCFIKASLVIDRFHVQKLAYDAVQEIRIAHRWEAINKDNNAILEAKEAGTVYKAPTFSNGDTEKQLLAKWYKDIEEADFKSFNIIAATIYTHYRNILNFFDERSTNASAESLNAILKAFRRTQRGVSDILYV